jgi:23S rRNA G2069 N7-methylase RlmK/C1962 C5-methylase RlmI
MNEKWIEQSQMLVNRVRKNIRRLKLWASREGVTCYRIYDRDIPEIPLAIDWYEGRLLVAIFAGQGTILPDEQIKILVDQLAGDLKVPADQVFQKLRTRQKDGSQYQKLSTNRSRFVVNEGGFKFWVNLSDYLDTGLFLDHRRTRARFREESRGKHVLNLFAYTGAFSVYAAGGGASSTTTVDLSNTYLEWAGDNLDLNGFDEEHHRLIRDDVLGFLEDDNPPDNGYDLVIIDPPTISRSKRMENSLDLQRDHVRLINGTIKLCSPNAVIYFSTNFRKFKLDEIQIKATSIEDITKDTLPSDFRNKKIHRCFRIVG